MKRGKSREIRLVFHGDALVAVDLRLVGLERAKADHSGANTA